MFCFCVSVAGETRFLNLNQNTKNVIQSDIFPLQIGQSLNFINNELQINKHILYKETIVLYITKQQKFLNAKYPE